jgi:caffeoyl-CoA O-methyltransferase
MFKLSIAVVTAGLLLIAGWASYAPAAQNASSAADLDTKVRQFLEGRGRAWHDLNVPASDGQALYNIIVEHKYKSALEIGTSTGHSGIWIAWALSKNGGRLTTIEIDQNRHEQALANFRAAGVADIIDARMGDAHEIVPALKGPFDFVFSDADKDWYKNYLQATLPKLAIGGCFVSHNISERGYESGYSREYLAFARSIPNLETTVLSSGGSGMSVSYKKAEK